MRFMPLSLGKKFAFTWNIMWASCYVFVAVLASNVLQPGLGAAIGLLLYGVFIIAGAVLRINSSTERTGRVLLLIAGVFSLLSAVASFTGYIMWNVPFDGQMLFQYSMGIADTLGAIAMFALAK